MANDSKNFRPTNIKMGGATKEMFPSHRYRIAMKTEWRIGMPNLEQMSLKKIMSSDDTERSSNIKKTRPCLSLWMSRREKILLCQKLFLESCLALLRGIGGEVECSAEAFLAKKFALNVAMTWNSLENDSSSSA